MPSRTASPTWPGSDAFELGGGRRQLLDLCAGPLERGLDVAGLCLAGSGLGEPFAGAVEGVLIHEHDDSVSAG